MSRATNQYSIGQYLALIILLRPAGAYWTFTVNAVDYVGNAGSKSVMFMIIVTPQSLIDDVNQFAAAGKIAQNEVNSLLSKLASAAKAPAKRNCANAATIYTSFISEVRARSGKKDDPPAAQIVIAWCRSPRELDRRLP